MNEMMDDTNSPMQNGHSAHVKSNVANVIRSLGYSKTVIKFESRTGNQELAIRIMERNVAESLFEDDFRDLRGR